MKIEVIEVNDDFIVVNKPERLSFHSEDGAGLFSIVKQQLNLEQIYPVHRLDKMTSGLIIFALNKSTATDFMHLFEQHKIEKYYLAISLEKPKKKQGWIKGDMQKSRRGSWKLTKTKENPAITYFISQSIKPKERLFLLKPYTGKTHQLRVALKSISAVIAGDARYQPLAEAEHEDRGYLHAYALKFSLKSKSYSWVVAPNTGNRFVSKEIKIVLKKWLQPWEIINA